jgi:predicted DNA-binding ribbon-helix-helix protein
MSKRALKAFRIENEIWERFKKIARHRDSDANKELRKLIKQYLAENSQLLLEIKEEKR